MMMMNRRVIRLCLVAGVLVVLPSWVFGQGLSGDGADPQSPGPVIIDGPPPPTPPAVVARDALGRVTLRATRIPEAIVLDGLLDDPIYSEVPSVSDFIQQEPQEGELATEQTEIWVFFDDRNLYVAARCWDSEPDRIIANEMRRDARSIRQNDNLAVMLDTFYDRRNGYLFETNPLGALRDGLVRNERDNNTDWNTVWDLRTSRFDQGWIVEFEIPFKSLRFLPGRNQIWGINFRRGVQWKNEDSFLNPISASFGNQGLYRFSSAATLVGIQVPSRSRTLEFKPYALTDLTTDNNVEPRLSNDFGGDIGFDAKYQVSSGLAADITYNTDFAQVEEDDQQVNLTRFSLFFPEKREFFLEGQGIFAFGGASARRGFGGHGGRNTPIMFFSRQIGLSTEGEVPIQVGGRLTGRAGAYSIGLLNIQADDLQVDDPDAADISATNFSVVRLQRDVLSRSNIGVIATSRSVAIDTPGSNQLVGADVNLALFQDVAISSYFARTWTDGLTGNDSSYLGSFSYNGDRYGARLSHLTVQENFNPEMGFIRRDNFRESSARLRFSPRPMSIRAVRKFSYEANLQYISDNDGALESRKLEAQVQTEFASGDRLNISYNRELEYLDAPFEIEDDVTLQAGSYSFQNVSGFMFFGGQRKLSGGLNFAVGEFFSGTLNRAGFFGRAEITPALSVEPNFQLNWVDLPEGAFTTELVRTRVNYTLSPRSFVAVLVQWNSSNDSVSTNIRFRWEYQPGSDIFFVYTDGRDTDVRGFPTVENRAFAIKLTRLLRF